MRQAIRILGIDPGLRRTGWGVIDVDGNRLIFVGCGSVASDDKAALAQRLVALHVGLIRVVEDFRPAEAAVEATFVNKDAAATLKLGQARGIALLVPASAGVAVAEYAPNLVKKTIIGAGHGEKAQIRAMMEKFQDKYYVLVTHAWGMTEMSPIGTLASLKPPFSELTGEDRLDILQTQGYPPFGVQMKITDDAGKELPWDGKTFGRLKVAGPAVSKAYFRVDANILGEDGYFDTGDVATIDQHGYMRITDRSKDVIKSGGEWISSIELENLAVAHPAVAEAAVIGVRHPKWDERPLLIVQLKQGSSATREDILKFMDGKIAKWWMPDDVAFVDGIPHTATGKILKTALRDQFKSYSFPNAA